MHKFLKNTEISAVITATLAFGLTVRECGGIWQAVAQQPNIAVAMLGQSVQDPTGTYSLVWTGPTIDVQMLSVGGGDRFSIKGIQSGRWVQLNSEGVRLPILVSLYGGALQVQWLEAESDTQLRVYTNSYCDYWRKRGYPC